MKNLVISFLLLGIVFPATSQYNTQLIDSTKHWSIANQPCPGCGGVLYSYYIKLQGDTMINSTSYTKILRSYDEFMEDWELYGFIREEDNKYFLRNLASEEGLVYDFTVNLGDTLAINNPFGFMPLEATITNIDSVYIEPANEYRKRITLFEYENFGYEEDWIEGIGSLAGITESGWDMTVLTGGDDYTLLCYYEDDELWYKDDFYSLCFYPLVGIPSNFLKENNTRIFPNPVRGISHLILDYPDHYNLIIRIFNSTGNIIEKYQITTPNKIEINSINYPKGIFFYQVLINNQQIINEKFIVI